MAFRSLTEALRAPWAKRVSAAPITQVDYAEDNGFFHYARNAAGTGIISTYGLSSLDKLHIDNAVIVGARTTKTFKLATNASITSQAFWIADTSYVITGIQCSFATADGAVNTAYIGKSTSTQTPAQAVSLMSGTFNMNAVANTVQTATLASARVVPNQPQITIAAGDRLVFVLASAVTSLAGVTITVTMVVGNKSEQATYVMNANGDLIAATNFYIANGEYVVSAVNAIWSTAGTNGGTVTYDVTKDTSTTAAGGGTSVLLAAVSVKTTANTVSTPALAASAATIRLSAGDRLGVKLNGTLTALAGVVVCVTLTPILDWLTVNFTLAKNANLGVDQDFFIADRTYQVGAISQVHATAAGGASTLAVVRDQGTTAPGGGTSMQSGTFNLNATAVTVQNATMLTPPAVLLAGDRMGIHWSAAVQSSAGLVVQVSLLPL